MNVSYWESKYKTCRAAFLEMSRYWKIEKKESLKDRQRIIQHCYDGLENNRAGKNAIVQFEKILGILNVSGYDSGKPS